MQQKQKVWVEQEKINENIVATEIKLLRNLQLS
jgi:hypothetical protein